MRCNMSKIFIAAIAFIVGVFTALACIFALSSSQRNVDVRQFYSNNFKDEFPKGDIAYIRSQSSIGNFYSSEWSSVEFILNESAFNEFVSKQFPGLDQWRILRPNESHGWYGGDGNMFTIEGTTKGDVWVAEGTRSNSLIKVYAFQKDHRILATRFIQ